MTAGATQLHEIVSTIRFVQGYRFLDRTGEALIKLEKVLDSGWIPGEISPKSGDMVNVALGLRARFDSESLSVIQNEYLDFELFKDQACKFYDVLRKTFEISRINVPTLRVVWQHGFETTEEAEEHLINLKLVTPKDQLLALMGGKNESLSFVICTADNLTWHGIEVRRRRRLDAKTILQQRQPAFDDRLVKRVRLLSSRQQDAMQALLILRKKQPALSPVAVQFELDDSFETEIDATEFNLADFYSESYSWSESSLKQIVDSKKGSPK